jgi:hypothetical protein
MVYSVAAARLPAFAETRPPTHNGSGQGTRVGRAHVEAAALMLRLFSDADTASGAGRVRPALSAYLSANVVSWLDAPATPAVRAKLLAIATDLTYLAGFLCFDDQRHGVAQRYYRIAAQLSRAANDPGRYAMALRGMSVQAVTLGHHHESWRLASAAVDSAQTHGRVSRAFLIGQLAVAGAADGDRSAALRHLLSAERLLDSGDSADGDVGAYHLASLAHQQAETLALLGDTPGAIRRLDLSLRHRPLNERRSRAITRARLAELRLGAGHLEHACAEWHAFLSDVPLLESRRIDTALRSLRAKVRPFAQIPAARDVLARSVQRPPHA